MAISTYNELLTAIENWLHRSGLTSRAPEFVSLGEARIGREVRARQMEQRVSSTPSSQYMSLPSDYISIRGIRLQGSTVGWLKYITPEQFFATFESNTQSTEKMFTIFGDELVFPRTPTETVELWYYKRLAALSSAVNTLFTDNPDLYLYASMSVAIPFLKKFEDMPNWETLYQGVRDQVNGEHKEGRYPAAPIVRLA
jgi:hypothetical protein